MKRREPRAKSEAGRVGARRRAAGGTNQQFIRGSVTFSPRLIVMFAESSAPARGLPENSSQPSFSGRIRRRKRGVGSCGADQRQNFISHCRIICSPFLPGNFSRSLFFF